MLIQIQGVCFNNFKGYDKMGIATQVTRLWNCLYLKSGLNILDRKVKWMWTLRLDLWQSENRLTVYFVGFLDPSLWEESYEFNSVFLCIFSSVGLFLALFSWNLFISFFDAVHKGKGPKGLKMWLPNLRKIHISGKLLRSRL